MVFWRDFSRHGRRNPAELPENDRMRQIGPIAAALSTIIVSSAPQDPPGL
jgi:hypothetical protein